MWLKITIQYYLSLLDECQSLASWRLYRAIRGGRWYKQTMTGELPGCFGSWWTRTPLFPHRYHFTEIIEDYDAASKS